VSEGRGFVYSQLASHISRCRLASFAGRHLGQRCFIVGNGPSLRTVNLTRLRGEFTFGLNRIYMLFDELGFSTTCLVAINRLVIEQCAPEMSRLTLPKFLSWNSRRFVTFGRDTIFLKSIATVLFSKDPRRGVVEGATVTYVAMQLAYFMGFSEVILIGVDHRFATKGKPHQEVTSEGDDPNHFDPRYFGKGFRWQLPDLERSEQFYRIARAVFEHEGRRIVDATRGGALTVFEKVDYDALF
jgi:hypothetical protein